MQIEVFKAGTHTDSNGRTKTWTEEDLNKIANSYNPQAHEAPVVIGHPKDNAPAYGWVESLKNKGGVLYAKVKDLVPEFVDAVKRGLYKKRSISLYPDMYLRHIGFLGAMPPAIKGLADIKFQEDEEAVTIEFEENQNKKEGKNMKLFDWLKGLAVKDGVMIDDMPKSFAEESGMAACPNCGKECGENCNFCPKCGAEMKGQTKGAAETSKEEKAFAEKISSFEEAMKKKNAELKTREDALKAKEIEGKKAEITSFCEGLLKQGRLTPAIMKHGMGVQNFLEQIAEIETVIEFSQGDEKKKQTPVEFMQSFLANLPKSIEFGEVAGRGKDAGSGEDRKEKMISDFMEKNQGATYRDAVLSVSKEHPEIFK